MTPTASPRHPWKALAVVLLVFAVVHGARAHVPFGEHEASHIRIVHADHDCAGMHIDIDGDDDADDDALVDVFDDGHWS
ncbi:MAG: hypothetical protein JF586_11100 [Burkholderiales bacterium]|nr:hypothetical protein [Burkholderiales bacterium]